MLPLLTPLSKKAYVAWDSTEKCLRYLKWADMIQLEIPTSSFFRFRRTT